jgi:transcriptional regulator with XRE-family HTH domain
MRHPQPAPDRRLCFGPVLFAHREAAALTQEELARRVGITKGYISCLESGKCQPPRVRRVAKFARVLGLSERKLQLLAFLDRAPDAIVADPLLAAFRDAVAKLPIGAPGPEARIL